jgi:signal transduction histidine kinase
LAIAVFFPNVLSPKSPRFDSPSKPSTRGEDVAGLLADLSGRISHTLSGLEKGAALSGGLAELRALLSQQEAIHQSIAQRNRELDAFSGYLQAQVEREKALLARELHDSLGGILTPAKMDLAFLEARLGKDPEYIDRVHRLSALIDQGIDLKRRIIENLRPSLLDHLGLASALTWYVDETCRNAGIDCHLQVSEQLERLPPDVEIALYRLVQECVANTVKHAHAKNLDLHVERTPRGLSMVASDDGVGIEDIEQAKTLSHGLAGMMHRVRSINGTFEIHSQPGKGTRIEVFVPL